MSTPMGCVNGMGFVKALWQTGFNRCLGQSDSDQNDRFRDMGFGQGLCQQRMAPFMLTVVD